MKQRDEGCPDLEKGNPQESGISLPADSIQGGSDETDKLPQRLDRYGKAKSRAIQNVAYLRETGKALGSDSLPLRYYCQLAASIDRCGSYLNFHHYYTAGKVRLVGADFCKKHLLCPLCAVRRGAKSLKAYLDKFEYLRQQDKALRLSLVTLTVKNGPDLGERMHHLKNGVSVLLKRRNHAIRGRRVVTEWAKLKGVVGSYEVTNRGKGWHPHVHMIALHNQYLEYGAMIEEWRRITGDSYILHVDPARHPDDPARDFLEVFKYAVKFSDLSPAHNVEAFLTLKGKRLLFSAGAFRGVQVPEELTDEALDDLPYAELFYRYVSGGYHLERYDGQEVAA
ncbi:MAG TPA: hypothetical protein EYP90_06065 [Chromatiaceae bacterium]|nr:hypothetical protein [Chromatiaceae bacterium]